MPQFDHARVMHLLGDAMELPTAQRASFLDSACGDEPALRERVEQLLGCADQAARAFDATSEVIARADPDQIGPYEIIAPLGEGGMAIVYKAQQQEPVKRLVAVKLIKLGMDTRNFVARFEAERQALAMMDHPNIAKVYDAGTTETGRPYFVMEFVSGRTILKYCDEHNQSLRQRLELFIVVCEAVEHAHRKGIIHRDLKDSNVLIAQVDGKPVPKVIDFGVAKAIQQPLTDRTLQTEQGQLIGTPEYMSPEQAERGISDIDTRSDVYSLGVLLYELVAGVQAISSERLRSGGYEQIQRIIRESEPARPSTRLSALGGDDAARIAQRRKTDLPTLIRELRSEMEWIPLKAMRKDREQRYRSASELADEIRNYLEGRPLLAGPESGWYRTRKFLRRHKAGVAASATMLLLLVAGIVATSWQAVRATRAERVADREAAAARKQASIARSVNELMTGMVSKANRGQQKGDPNITVRAVMDAAAADLRTGALSQEPEVDAALRGAIGGTYNALGLYDAAEPLLRQAVEQRIGVSGEEDLEVAVARNDLAALLVKKGKYDEAEGLYRQVLATRRRLQGNDQLDVAHALNNLGGLFWTRGDFVSAEPFFRQALETKRKLLGTESPDTALSINNLAALLQLKGDYDAAEPLLREALAIRLKVRGEEHLEVASTMGNLATLLLGKGDYAAAEPFFRQALDIRRKLQGEEHPDVAQSLNNLGGALHQKGDYAAAEQFHRQALAMRRKLLGEDHSDVLMSMNNLAGTLACENEIAEAEMLYRDALGRSRRVSGDDHANTLTILKNLGRMLSESGRPAEAEPLLGELYQRAQRAKVPPRTAAECISVYGPCLIKLGRFQDAEQPLRLAYQRLIAAGMEKQPQTWAVVNSLAELCEQIGRPDEAASWRVRLKQLHAATQPASRPATNPL